MNYTVCFQTITDKAAILLNRLYLGVLALTPVLKDMGYINASKKN